MRIAFALVVLFVVTSATRLALAEQLLMEVHHANQSGFNSCGGLPGDNTSGCAALGLSGFSNNGVSANFNSHLSTPDVWIPRSLNDPAVLANFEQLLSDPIAVIDVSTAGFTGVVGVVRFSPDDLWGDIPTTEIRGPIS